MNRLRKLATVAALGLLGLTPSVARAAPRAPLPSLFEHIPGERFVPGHVLLRFRGAPFLVEGAPLERLLGDGSIHRLHARDESDAALEALVARLRRDPRVEWAEREHLRHTLAMTPDDPLFAMQWNLTQVKLPDAWTLSTGSAAVVIAVLDTGSVPHPDLAGQVMGGFDFVTDPMSAGDGDGRDADPSDPGTLDEGSSGLHGLQVMGVLGAATNNSAGMAGVVWATTMVPVRVIGVQSGAGSDGDIADGIRRAAGLPVAGAPPNLLPAQVINMSFGGPGLSAALQLAIDEANAEGVIVVAAAGNGSADTATYAPSGQSGVIAVGAVDAMGEIASYSNVGPRNDLMAPGGDLLRGPGVLCPIRTATGVFDYKEEQGTSQAAPHVAGVAALVRTFDPRFDGARTLALLKKSADASHICPKGCGAGLLDANAALTAAAASVVCAPACPEGEFCSANKCVLPNGGMVRGGCAVGGVRDGGPDRGASLSLIAAVLIALGVRRRRR